MIVFIVCICIGIYLSFRIGEEKGLLGLILAIMGSCVGAFAGMLIVGIYTAIEPGTIHHYEFEKVELTTLGGTSELQGSFFLGSGSVGTEQFYRFYYKTADGGKKFGKISAEAGNVTVYEEDRKDAYITKVGEESMYSTKEHLWLIPKILNDKKNWKYAIHVPKGTIKKEYNIDLK